MLRKREGGRRSLRECTMLFASPASGGGRRATRVGWGHGLSREKRPHPNPPPQAGEGEGCLTFRSLMCPELCARKQFSRARRKRCTTLFASPACGGRPARSARRVGAWAYLESCPHPNPPPQAGEGDRHACAASVVIVCVGIALIVHGETCHATLFASPACGGGRRATRVGWRHGLSSGKRSPPQPSTRKGRNAPQAGEGEGRFGR